MSSSPHSRRPRSTATAVSIRFGKRFEAHATGWGVVVVALVALAVLTLLGMTAV